MCVLCSPLALCTLLCLIAYLSDKVVVDWLIDCLGSAIIAQIITITRSESTQGASVGGCYAQICSIVQALTWSSTSANA